MHQFKFGIRGEAGDTPVIQHINPSESENKGIFDKSPAVIQSSQSYKNASYIQGTEPIIGIPQKLRLDIVDMSANIESVTVTFPQTNTDEVVLNYLEQTKPTFTVQFVKPAKAPVGAKAIEEGCTFTAIPVWEDVEL